MNLPIAWRDRACVVWDVANAPSWFAGGELPELRTEKRRNEWMLSRIAEKTLRRRGAAGPHVSYAHSGPYGAAAVDGSPVGIDVEVVRAIAPRAAHLFLTREEEEAVSRCDIAHALLHFWSAKEARWKQLGGAIATLKRVPLTLIDYDAKGCRFDVVVTTTIGDAVVALTRPTS